MSIKCTSNYEQPLIISAGQYKVLRSDPNSWDSWLVRCFGLNGPLRQYFSLYRAASQREGERERNDR